MVNASTRPSCLIVEGVGRCSFDRRCADLVFGVVDRRCEKGDMGAMLLASNV